jgi:hypothetical protein
MAEGKQGTAAPTEFAPLASDEASAEVEMQSKRDRRSCCRCAAGAALVPLICGAVLLVGRAVELHAVAHARSTDGLYSSSWVCVRDEAGREQSVSNHSLLATSGGTLSVVHCAKCGACSSETDMAIYQETRLNITRTTARVALRVFFGGEQAVRDGLREQLGFTEACNDCWTADVLCSQRHCKFTCLTQMLFSGGLSDIASDDEGGGLNDCIRCDERMCGPDFARCAGANRRRAGIPSDIHRPNRSLCSDAMHNYE